VTDESQTIDIRVQRPSLKTSWSEYYPLKEKLSKRSPILRIQPLRGFSRGFPGVARFNGKPRSGDVVSGTSSWRGGGEEGTNYASGSCRRARCWRGERGDRSLGSRRVARVARGRNIEPRNAGTSAMGMEHRRLPICSADRGSLATRARDPRPAFLTSKHRRAH